LDSERNRERWFWTITSTLAVAIVMALYAFSTPDVNNTATNAAPALAHTTDVKRPPATASLERAADPRGATVFECRESGQRIYSDQRCGPSAAEHPVQAPNSMDAQDTGILSSPEEVLARSRSERQYAQEAAPDAGLGECSRIEEERNAIDARMRKGYNAPEGEWLRERLRVLSSRYYDLRCRHFH
jgi:hypothetical protein